MDASELLVSGHLHAVTAIGSADTPTGAQLTFDNEGRLAAWQNAPSNPTSTTSNLYDGAGTRVEQQVTSGFCYAPAWLADDARSAASRARATWCNSWARR